MKSSRSSLLWFFIFNQKRHNLKNKWRNKYAMLNISTTIYTVQHFQLQIQKIKKEKKEYFIKDMKLSAYLILRRNCCSVSNDCRVRRVICGLGICRYWDNSDTSTAVNNFELVVTYLLRRKGKATKHSKYVLKIYRASGYTDLN